MIKSYIEFTQEVNESLTPSMKKEYAENFFKKT